MFYITCVINLDTNCELRKQEVYHLTLEAPPTTNSVTSYDGLSERSSSVAASIARITAWEEGDWVYR